VLVRLSALIESFNSRFSIDISHADALMLFIELPAHLAADEAIRRAARDNTQEQFTEPIIRRTTWLVRSSTGRNAATSC